MEEFTSQTGGRYTYVDDFINLQKLSLAFGEIFTNCDNFIVSGCEVSGNSISAGIVWLNGKLRVVEEVPSITGDWPQYIYEVNETKNVPYASGIDKIGREKWGAAVGKTVPTTKTPLTNAMPKAIQINSNGGLRMKDAWFGKYALLLDPAASEQSVQGTVNLQKLNVNGDVKSTSKFQVASAGIEGVAYIEGGNLVFKGNFPNSKRVQMVFSGGDRSVKFLIGNTLVATILENGIKFTQPLTLPQVNAGNVRTSGSSIFNASTSNDDGEININMLGLSGGTSCFRTTKIGDGKGNALLSVLGKDRVLKADGQFVVNANVNSPLVIRAQFDKTQSSIVRYIAWQDAQMDIMASLGYTSDTDMNFALNNGVGNIVITGYSCVDLGPVIKENGIPLSTKYALSSAMEKGLNAKANAQDVYSKSDSYSRQQCDNTFAKKANGLSQFIVDSTTDEDLCKQIGALREADVTGFAKKSECLADMAESEETKAQIRQNIGAVSKSDLPKDTGWVQCTPSSVSARQIGKIVCIQGQLSPIQSGIAFVLPDSIDPPAVMAAYTAPPQKEHILDDIQHLPWGCTIQGGKKECVVSEGSWHNGSVPILITYMAS